MSAENNQEERTVKIVPPEKAVTAVVILALSGALLLLALFATYVKEYKYIGRDVNAQTTITVVGDGESYGSPDIATVSYTITQESKSVAEARKVVDEKMKTIHQFLNKSGVENKDIKANYSFYPKYEWQQKQIECISYPCIHPVGKQVLTGYEVSEQVDVIIRGIDKDADKAGAIVGGLADNGATNLSGPNFTVEHEDTLQAEAREAAIAKAKAKADQLAKDLGVSIVRIVSFNEGGNYPMAYGGATMMKSAAMDTAAPSEAANIPSGQSKYTSNVTIVYEIK